MRRYKYKKHYIWNPAIAYITGVIASDGCLSNNGRHINVTSKDIEMLQNVRKALNINTRIGTKLNGFGGVGHYIQFSDVALYDFLYDAGITPAKSKTLQKVKVPDEFYGHFLRGLFDGDGYIHGFWDKRWRSSLMYYVGFVSASPNFLDWVKHNNRLVAGTEFGVVKMNIRAQTLLYAKYDSRKLFNLMYKDKENLYLSRKYNKFVDFLKQDPYPDKAINWASGGTR